MRVVDLFSCVGGHALGLHSAGFQTVQFVEKDEWRRKVLAHHFPEVPIHDDVRSYQPRPSQADILVGGPPCQRTSVASAIHGKRTGESLWPEMLRIADHGGYRWVVVEQPPGNSEWEATVKSGLARIGYYVAGISFSAADLGAPHIRRRVFTIAHRDLSRLQVAWSTGSSEIERIKRRATDRNPWLSSLSRTLRVDDGLSGRVDRRARIEAIGDSNPPAMMALIGKAIMTAEQQPSAEGDL